MTNRISGLFVALDKDIRDDHIDLLIMAIKQLRGVGDVTAHVSDPNLYIAQVRARHELTEKIWQVLEEKP